MSKWKVSQIKDFGRVITGYTPSTTNSKFWGGEIPFYSPTDFNEDVYCRNTERTIHSEAISNDRIVQENSLMVTCIASIGKIALATRKGVTNQQINSILFYESFDPKYCYYLIKNNINELIKLGGTTAVPIVNKADFEKIHLRHHSEKTEQQQIAKILSTADGVIEKTQVAITKYKAIKQGMLQDLFTRGIDLITHKLRPPYEDAPHLYKESKLGMIPKEWDEKIFGKEVDLIHGHQFRDYDFTEFGIPVVKIGQVKPENIDLSNCSFVGAHRVEEFQNEIIRNGDVLMALTGATLGKACLVGGLNGIVLQNYRVGRFEPIIKENDIDNEFLFYLLIAGELLTQIFNKVNTGAQGNIGKADFEKATFKKPPFEEQKRIAERLKAIDNKLKTEQIYLQKQQQIKKGLMKDLLTWKKLVKVAEELVTQHEN